jgi:tRNA(fMet)-specific endonuclease VapC
MIRYLIDADIVVYALTGQHPHMRARFERRAPGEVGLSAITLAEVSLGIARGHPPGEDVLRRFLNLYPVQPFDEGAARTYATLPFRRARFDRLLAAHALSIGAVMVTNNEADFADIPGLRVENWTTPL